MCKIHRTSASWRHYHVLVRCVHSMWIQNEGVNFLDTDFELVRRGFEHEPRVVNMNLWKSWYRCFLADILVEKLNAGDLHDW